MNNFFKATVFAGLAASISTAAAGENLTANNCQVHIKKVQAAPSSHGSASLGIVVKAGWIGNDEYIEDVKFYGHATYTDLGNAGSCHSYPSYGNQGWEFVSSQANSYHTRDWGEYYFSFPVKSGSVVSQCPGFNYTWIGSFFVQTNKNTYWLNPNLDANEQFYFDANGYSIISRMGGTYNPLPTTRSDLSYYNPGHCQN